MILQIVNTANYEQSITLHTGEAKYIAEGLGIRINTGNDHRLINYYASLINYNFNVDIVSASDAEVNNFNDALAKFTRIKESNKISKVESTYTTTAELLEPHPTLIPENEYDSRVNTLPDVKVPFINNNHRTYLDSHEGLVEGELEVPSDAIISNIITKGESYNETNVAKSIDSDTIKIEDSENDSLDNKYSLLEQLDESKLKDILINKFNESTKIRAKWRLIQRVIELADTNNVDINELISQYNN